MSTPVFPFIPACAGAVGQSTPAQGPAGVQGPPPALAIGNVSTLAAGSQAAVALRVNPAGGYFIDFGIPGVPSGVLTQDQANALYAQLVPTNGTYRIVTNANGTFLELWNPTQEKWNPITTTGVAGQEQIAIQPSEV